jgi:FkbM family methyltransferase
MRDSTGYPRLNSAVERIVRLGSAFIRSIPTNRSLLGGIKSGCIDRSAGLRDYRFDFDFHCRRPDVRWSASGFPDLLTRRMLFAGIHDEDVIAALENVIRPGDVVYDVGAHHGLMTVIAARAVGPSGAVVSFEPNPRALDQIRRHIALNGVTNAVVEEIALSDEEGETSFYVQAGDVSWNSTLIRDFVDEEEDRFVERITVRTETMDGYVARSRRVPRVIKLDAEGAEMRILKGAETTLRDQRPFVIMEMNPASARSVKLTLSDFIEFWKSLSYRIVAPGTDVFGHYTMDALEPFDEIKHTAGQGLANVICIPEG